MPNIIKSHNAEKIRYNGFRDNIFEELKSDDEIEQLADKVDEECITEAEAAVLDDRSDLPSEDIEELQPAPKEPKFDVEEFLSKVRAQAQELSEEILDKAHTEAELAASELRSAALSEGQEQGYKQGYNEGYEKGYVEAYEKGLKEVSRDCERLLDEIQAGMELFREEKKQLYEKNLEGMKELSIAVAEKVISMNIESQSDVIKNMIISALDNAKATQWIKIHISGFDSQRYFEIEQELLESIRHISEFVKVEIVEGAQPGTCIIEMPDKIIDASIATQMDNIKNMLDN